MQLRTEYSQASARESLPTVQNDKRHWLSPGERAAAHLPLDCRLKMMILQPLLSTQTVQSVFWCPPQEGVEQVVESEAQPW